MYLPNDDLQAARDGITISRADPYKYETFQFFLSLRNKWIEDCNWSAIFKGLN
jgi:hypothetical protein